MITAHTHNAQAVGVSVKSRMPSRSSPLTHFTIAIDTNALLYSNRPVLPYKNRNNYFQIDLHSSNRIALLFYLLVAVNTITFFLGNNFSKFIFVREKNENYSIFLFEFVVKLSSFG